MSSDMFYVPPAVPTPDQQKIAQQMRVQMQDVLQPEHDDACLHRFLRARSYNINNASTMLRNYITWRSALGEINPKDFADKPWCNNGSILVLDHKDNYGRPIIIFVPRDHNPYLRDLASLTRYFIYKVEGAIRDMAPGVEQFVLVIDFVNCGYRNVNDIPLGREVANVFHNMYPERLGCAVLCNSPWFFGAVWKVLSLLLDEKTKKKTLFLGKDYKKQMTSFVNADYLYENFGGNLPNYKPPMSTVDKATIDKWTPILAGKEPLPKSEPEPEPPKAEDNMDPN